MFNKSKLVKATASALALVSLAACGGGGGSSGVPILGPGSTQAQGWVVTVSGTSIATGSSTVDQCVLGQGGSGILCNVSGHNNTADPASGAIIENYGVNLVATVTNSGGPVGGATVTFSIGSSQTATSGSYCDIATTTTTPNCTANGVGGTLTAIAYQPGLNDGTGKVTTPITATTGADGKAYATYYPGGRSGTDVVSIVATSSAASPAGNILQAQNSATMVVN